MSARLGKCITFTASNDTYDGDHITIVGMTFQGSGLTAAQHLVVRDLPTVGGGAKLADYLVEAATDNADLWGAKPPRRVRGLSIDNNTIAGTWTLDVFVE